MDIEDKCIAWFFVAWLLVGIGLGILTRGAFGQEHQHGVDGLPDWYDPACCNKQDCRPVPDEDVEFFPGDDGKGAILHKPTGFVFPAAKWRPSQDERYHLCYRNASGDDTPYWVIYCAYIRAGV